MKVLHIAECAGGVDKYLSMLLPLLRERFEQVFICSGNYDVARYHKIADRVYQLDMKQTFSPFRVAEEVRILRRLIAQETPDIVYCHSSFAGALGRLACIGQNVKVVYNPHGWAFNMLSKSLFTRFTYLIIERLLARVTDRIVCISEAEYKSALKKRICSDGKLTVIMNGIRVSEVEDAVPVSREELGFSEDDYVIGMVGRLVPQKAPDTFIKAGKLIKENIPNAVFVIVGDGEKTQWVKEYARKNGLKVYITGWVNNPYSYMKTFDLAVLLSRWEGFGLSIAEYMAAGKNVIATNVDALPTLIEDGVDGLLVDVDSPEDVKDKALYLYSHPEEAEAMKEKARQKAGRQFDINRVADQHAGLFTGLFAE